MSDISACIVGTILGIACIYGCDRANVSADAKDKVMQQKCFKACAPHGVSRCFSERVECDMSITFKELK